MLVMKNAGESLLPSFMTKLNLTETEILQERATLASKIQNRSLYSAQPQVKLSLTWCWQIGGIVNPPDYARKQIPLR